MLEEELLVKVKSKRRTRHNIHSSFEGICVWEGPQSYHLLSRKFFPLRRGYGAQLLSTVIQVALHMPMRWRPLVIALFA